MSTFPPAPSFGFETPRPARTSIAAVFALIAGILGFVVCCAPYATIPISAVAVLLGIVALIAVGSSHGSVKGRGMAVTGVVFGGLGLVIGLVVLMFWSKFLGIAGPYRTALLGTAQGNATAITAVLDPSANAGVTPEAVKTFSDEVTAKIGTPVGVETGLFKIYGALKIAFEKPAGPQAQAKYAGGRQMIPMLLVGQKDSAALLMFTDQANQSPGPLGAIVNVAVITKDGSTIWLYDPSAPAP